MRQSITHSVFKSFFFAASSVFFAFVYPLLVWLRVNDRDSVTVFLIPVFVFVMLLRAYLRSEQIPVTARLLPAAFLFIFAGDFVINVTGVVVLTPLFFLGAHLFLIFYFLKLRPFHINDLLPLCFCVFVSVSVLLFIRDMLPDLKTAVVFVLYLVVLTVMVWRGTLMFGSIPLTLSSIAVAAGSILFYATDVFVGLHYLTQSNVLIFLIWLCYPPALYLLTVRRA